MGAQTESDGEEIKWLQTKSQRNEIPTYSVCTTWENRRFGRSVLPPLMIGLEIDAGEGALKLYQRDELASAGWINKANTLPDKLRHSRWAPSAEDSGCAGSVGTPRLSNSSVTWAQARTN
jgi:hypothetical protein